jgi:TetR/AcrR family transcriptional repressor of nem operon
MSDSDSRSRIVAAALDLFCERGFAAVGTQEICARAGVQKGTLYHFFPGKTEVALAALDHYGEAVRRAITGVAGGPGDPAAKLMAVFDLDRAEAERSVAARGAVCGCLLGMFAQELAATDPRVRERAAAVTDGWAEAVARIVAELAAAGVVPPGDPVAGAHRVLAYLQGVVQAAKTANDPAVISRMAGAALGLLGGTPAGRAGRSGGRKPRPPATSAAGPQAGPAGRR